MQEPLQNNRVLDEVGVGAPQTGVRYDYFQEMLLAWGVSVLRCFYSFKFGVSGRIRGSDIYITLFSGFLAEHL